LVDFLSLFLFFSFFVLSLVTGRAEFVIAAAVDGDGFFKLGEEQAPGSLSQHAWCEINVGEISGLYFCLGQAVIIY
jgi:hypothetical protein